MLFIQHGLKRVKEPHPNANAGGFSQQWARHGGNISPNTGNSDLTEQTLEERSVALNCSWEPHESGS